MTVIAFDGKTVAADKLGNDNGTKMRATKLRRMANGDILACSGSLWQQEILMRWYADGQKPEDWPKFQQEGDDWTLMLAFSQGNAYRYERYCHPFPIENAYYAWGSGQDYAMGALAMGATAKRAVEIACELCTTCGLGVDVYEIEQSAKLEAV